MLTKLRERITRDKPNLNEMDASGNASDRLLFMGNWHDAVSIAIENVIMFRWHLSQAAYFFYVVK